jgi:hypothetical protein
MANAIFKRKPVNIDELKVKPDVIRTGNQYVIEKTIELDQDEYDEFADNLLAYYDFIEENIDKMYVDTNDVWHCILVKARNGIDGICCQAERYSYCRYGFYLSSVY